MKRSIITALIVGSIASIWLLSGCGNPTGGGGGGGGGGTSATGPNNGTVSGHVYSYNGTTGVYTGLEGYNVSVSTEAMSMEVAASTDAAGKYTLKGLPSGTVEVTVTDETYGFESFTIAANSDTMNFVIGYDVDPGTATIRGTLEGIPAPIIHPIIDVYALSGKDYNYHWPSFCDETALTYEVTGAPDDGETYIQVDCFDGSTYRTAYNKLNTLGGGVHNLNISFEAGVTIEGINVFPPSGYSISDTAVIIWKNNTGLSRVGGDWVSSGPTSGSISGVTPLKSGDNNLRIYFHASNGGTCDLYKYFYNCTTANGQTFNFSFPAMPPQLIKYPINGGAITSVPTFEWSSVPGADYYEIVFMDNSSLLNMYWDCLTYGTKITLPACLMNKLVSGHSYEVTIYAYKYFNSYSICKMNEDTGAYMDFQLIDQIDFTLI